MDSLTILIYVVVLFVLVFAIYSIKMIHTESKQKFKGEDVPALEVTKEEFYKTLNFMLMFGIISFDEYNQIQTKGLPYVR